MLTLYDPGESSSHAITISILPDDTLLEIFDFYAKDYKYPARPLSKWHLLAQICHRWRQVLYASPRRLNLQIFCTFGSPVRKNLAIWPAFPIAVNYYKPGRIITPDHEDDVIAALEHPDRVCYVRLDVTGSHLGRIATVMQEPFQVLTHLIIFVRHGNAPVLPAEFLRGSAPCLQEITFAGIPFPSLPTLLLSASDLVTLKLYRIQPTGYFPPEAMASCLAALPRLEWFIIEFQSATPRPNQVHLPPMTRTLLPALTSFEFKGTSEYLENLVTHIDSPQLDWISIRYLNQLIDFQVAQLSEFVDRSVGPKLTPFGHAQVIFRGDWVTFAVHPDPSESSYWYPARTIIPCEGIDWQVSHIAQVLSHFSPTLSTVAHLKLEVQLKRGRQLEGVDDVEWLHLLHQFSAVKTLYLCRKLAKYVALALDDITAEMVDQVLPSLDLIHLAGQPASSVKKFVTARLLSGRPVTVIRTKTEFDKRLETYVSLRP